MLNLLLTSPRPEFVDGQLLKKDDLNAVLAFLEPQTRATHISLIGAGIFYGLELKYDPGKEPHKITVTKGAGVSSEGYLFFLEHDQEFELEKHYADNSGQTGGQDERFDLKDLNPHILSPELVDRWEFVPKPANQSPINPPANFSDACFVLYFDSEASAGDSSCFASFNREGRLITYKLKLLALTEDDLKKIWLNMPSGSSGGGGTTPAQFPYVERLPVWNLIKNKIAPPPAPGQPMPNVTWEELCDAYFNLCRKALYIVNSSTGEGETVVKSIRTILGNAAADDLKTVINQFDGNQNKEQLQYLHDYLKDLVGACEEWEMNKPEERKALWCPDTTHFPKFIALGRPASAAAADPCRMPRYYPGIPDGSATAPADPLLQRLTFMAAVANLGFFGLAEVKITGSRRKCPPLSEQAIPFYYKNNATLRELWNPAMTAAGRTKAIPSYFPHPSPPDAPFDQPLRYDLEQYDFYRIEGHIGKSLKEGLQKIETERHELNLPFKIVALRIDTAANITYNGTDKEILAILNQMQFSVFAKDHPGMEHMGGVPRGGTFILVFQETLANFDQEFFDIIVNSGSQAGKQRYDIDYLNNVLQRRIVADFCLPYGCYEGPNIQYCFVEVDEQNPMSDFEVREISYRWDEKNNASFAKVELENRSQFAKQFKWYIDLIKDGTYTRMDVNGDGVLDDDDFYPNKDTLALEFDLAEVQKIQVRLHAIKSGYPEDTSEQVIELCPPEMSLLVFDPTSTTLVEEVTMELPTSDVKTLKLVFTPTGGILSADNPDFSSLILRTATEASVVVDGNVAPGDYILRYHFCAGQERQVHITLTKPEGRPSEEIIAARSAADPRRDQFIANVEGVADKSLTATAAYKRTLAFLTLPHLTVEDAVKEFEGLARLLFNSMGKTGGATDEQYAALLRNATWSLLDKAVAISPTAMPAPLQTALETLVPKLQDVGVDVNALRKDWNGKDLKKDDNAKIIKAIEAILKT